MKLLIAVVLFSLQAQAQQMCSNILGAGRAVIVENNQIMVDGEAQPQLFGGEFQYFRLRGGYGKNVPRSVVIDTWKRGLDQMVKAGMNSISFYIPWDFHEYAPGKFDFTGTVDEDGDGNADYPSRDILTFIDMVEKAGIKRILLRPGPYVNAEWGFLGFGAIPEWFHDQYPDSHMRNPEGFKTKLYDYHNEDFLKHTRLWFEALRNQVLTKVIGPGKPGLFLQLDNETNFQWQSIYNHDYGPAAVARYQTFMQNRYHTLTALNQAQGTHAASWNTVKPPTEFGKNMIQDRDWYNFQDDSIYTYLQKIRGIWEDLGVKEPNVIFTLAESFNAAENGLLPNYKLRNARGKTGLTTINVYSSTYPLASNVLMHNPYKADHDVMAAASANAAYWGREEEAVIGPEIHTGWFDPTVVSDDARQQTYLTLIGRGLKALFLYYFNEGYNWQVEWGHDQIMPYFDRLHADPRYSSLPTPQLPDPFWVELQKNVDREFMTGWNVKDAVLQDVKAAQDLHFGTPLDKNAQPTAHFALLEKIGQRIVKPYGQYLSATVSIHDAVTILTDSDAVTRSPIPGVNSLQMHSDFAGGLVGYLAQAGLNPRIHHWGINSLMNLAQSKIILVQDSGNLKPEMVQWLAHFANNGGTVISFIGDSVARSIGAPTASQTMASAKPVPVSYRASNSDATHGFDALGSVVRSYTMNATSQPLVWNGQSVIGYKFKHGKGNLIQLGAIFHDAFNSDAYGLLNDVPARRTLLDDIVHSIGLTPEIQVAEGGDRIVAFGRKIAGDASLWITVKSGQLAPSKFHLKVNADLLVNRPSFEIRDVMGGTVKTVTRAELIRGFPVALPANGSTAFYLSPR